MLPGPSVPAAPGRFSITIDWPRCFSVAVASARIAMSVEPPGGHGTINVTGRVGNCCACAAVANATTAAASRLIFFMIPPSFRRPEFSGYRCGRLCPIAGRIATEGMCGVLADEIRAGRVLLGRSGRQGRDGGAVERRAQSHRQAEPDENAEGRAVLLLSFEYRQGGCRRRRNHSRALSGSDRRDGIALGSHRSEEHTSELQSH